ncbi:DNA-binding protein [Halanaerobiaceae bacterium Z-7014]|uniref:DNA-binding protein n=1 Tax=Halonatronomonas betaini TaxID=2778430 RepID=A0A931AS04_9FIRM|nr:PPC domain-containing DNA-binding protein [Halonatronomonas betaini]MBF8435765.1 DNA-binding protein [Halonatronomonas betaini]
MKYTEADRGRVFVSRLEDGDKIPEDIERMAEKESISSAILFFLGGLQKGSKFVTGPEENNSKEINPIIEELAGISEAVGIGTIFPDEEGKPKLHLHSAAGRKKQTITGCSRAGLKTWLVGEVIILEIINHNLVRKFDAERNLELLNID